MIDTGEGKIISSIAKRIAEMEMDMIQEHKEGNKVLTTLYYKGIPLELEIPVKESFLKHGASQEYNLIGINDLGQIYKIKLPKRLLTVENPNE